MTKKIGLSMPSGLGATLSQPQELGALDAFAPWTDGISGAGNTLGTNPLFPQSKDAKSGFRVVFTESELENINEERQKMQQRLFQID
jgi:hypothetical protein